jgi:hypothetical protein
MSATFLCPARLPLCIRLGRSERPCAPSGIEKASVFRCPIEHFSQRIARKPVSMFQPTFFSATSRAEPSSRRCCEMEKEAVSSFTEQSESDIRSMNLPACGIGNRLKTRLPTVLIRIGLWSIEHAYGIRGCTSSTGTCDTPCGGKRSAVHRPRLRLPQTKKGAGRVAGAIE